MRHTYLSITTGLVLLLTHITHAGTLLPPGHRPESPGVHALTGAVVVIQPGQTLPHASILIRNSRIEAVGADIDVPPDAQIHALNGHTIYAGFIDPLLVLSNAQPVSTSVTVPIHDHNQSGRIRFFGVPGAEADPGQPGPGHESGRFTPQHRAADGFSPSHELLDELHALGFTAANITPGQNGILRGSSALATLAKADPNETLLKAGTFQHVSFAARSGNDNEYPRSLMGVIAAIRQVFLDAGHYSRDQDHYRQHPGQRPRPPFNPALDALHSASQRNTPVLFEPGSVLMVDRAIRLARELNLDPLIVASGQEWRRPDIIRLTNARFIVPIHFPELPKLPGDEDWSQVSLDQLRAWDWAPENPALLRQLDLSISLTTFGLEKRETFRKNLALAIQRGLSETDALAALTTNPAQWCGLTSQLGTIEPGKLANLTIVRGSYFNPSNTVREVWIEGRLYPIAKSLKPPADNKDKDAKDKEAAPTPPTERQSRVAKSPLDTRGPLAQPRALLIRNATLWTCGPQGRLTNSDLLIVDGRIQEVGTHLSLPPSLADDSLLLDATGQHVTPGLIDAHSHSMILGDVNEATLPSTAMVRIDDVVNSESANIYNQLAGGLTTAMLLHGSANPIGGQSCVIKLREGASPEGLKFTNAPPGIKFALGENVKQSNWGAENTTRFPQTRMGVPTFFANRFTAARQYLEQRNTPLPGHGPLRRDLELETLGEIIDGKRWIHCHSYRQDEILALLRLMEEFGIRIGTLQHVLEGYKIADEIAAHGAGASCFADWWAYKFEVIDAIPHAGSLMHERGVLVSFNSDSSDLARRLNLEAAKAVKYGSTTETEALHFVTINPARQLRIDPYVGSLEPGKDADFVLWSASPLSTTTRCLQTWIEGRKYFDQALAPQRIESLQNEKEQLLTLAKKLSKTKKTPDPGETAAQSRFFQTCLEHQHDTTERHCLDHD